MPALAVPTDTGDVAQCRRLVERRSSDFGRLDVVVSSAAKGTPNHTIMNSDLADWEQSWLVNVLGPLELCRSAVPHLRPRAAVRSSSCRRSRCGRSTPAGCVRGDEGRADHRGADVGARGGVDEIRVNVVVPGFVPGPEHRDDVRPHGRTAGTTPDAVQEEMAADTALRRLPAPDDIADAVVFLASDRARSITGPDARRQRRTVDGLVSERERVFYSSSVHDEREIEAVVEVLRSGPQGLWPGRRVVRMEREVAARFGKAHGVMCNSGSSALYLAVELLDLPPGAEVVTCALTFSTDVAPIVRGGWSRCSSTASRSRSASTSTASRR